MGSTFTGQNLLNAHPPGSEVWNFNIGNPSSYPTIYKGHYFPVDRQPDTRYYSGTQQLSWFQTNHPDWIEYKCDKTTVAYEFTDYTLIPLDTSNPAVLSWLEQTFYAPTAASGSYQHLDFDNFQMSNGGFWSGQRCGHWTGAQGSSTWVQQYNGTNDDPNYRTNEIAMAKNLQTWLHTHYPSIQFAANFSYDNNYPAESDNLMSYVDLLFDEQGFTNGNSGPPFYYADNTWLAKAQHTRSFINAGHGWQDINQFGSSFSALTIAQKQWAIANYLLLKNSASWIYICGPQEYGTLLMAPEYTAQIGSPTNAFYQSQGVYMRDFTNGKAIVNPSSNQSFTITLPVNTYKDLYGNLINSITLPAISGIVLLDTSPITPTYTPTPTPAQANLIQNGSFENTGTNWLSPWGFQANKGATISQGTMRLDRLYSAKAYVKNASSADNTVQLYQGNVLLIQGRRYTITFWAKSGKIRTIRPAVSHGASPWTSYFSQSVSLTTSWQKFTFSFTSPQTDSNTMFLFNLANATGYVWIDAVSLQ